MEKKKNVTDLFIKHFDFWPHLSEPEKDLISAHTNIVRYTKGTQVHQGPLDCIGVLLIKSGQLRVYTMSEDGREVTLYRLFPDDVGILSASCALDAVTFDVYIDAEEDTEVLLTDAVAFRKLADTNVYVRCFGYEKAANRLSEMLWKMQQVLFLSADRRLAIFLLEESEKLGGDEIHMTHEQIARFMGTAREVVSRLVKYFNQEGWVKTARGCIRLTNREALRDLAG
ncbi:CRP/FNR family transcriptional regulator, anaerobic regulatory protein [Selenomonas sp. GACV-9]|uniref:Crp/Fnr family transcriptional regulator n=1 Tax=Selenomonas sp. GACV-9 TaxID=3158782 RepID=UPI0008EC2D9C|nr:CRP/FNR family transcriptional regulator, anaerobic regulatory protein [Selenomonas ruminantium]